MEIIYTEEPHKYVVNGVEYPALSTFMKDMGLYSYDKVPKHLLDKAARLGKAVHRATHLLDIDELGSYDDKIQPYIDAYNSFKNDVKPTFLEYEESVASRPLKLATTLDRVAKINGVVSDVEIKTTSAIMKDNVAIQTAGHKYIYNSMDKPHKIKKRYVLWLKGNGKYKLIPQKSGVDEQLFLCGARWYRFSQNKGGA